ACVPWGADQCGGNNAGTPIGSYMPTPRECHEGVRIRGTSSAGSGTYFGSPWSCGFDCGCLDTLRPLPNGTPCRGGMGVCQGGTCATCAPGISCPPAANACHVGVTTCAGGTTGCLDPG